MKVEDILKQSSTPLGAPAFPRGPYRFRNREYLNITYRTDAEALRKVLPEPLEFDEPLVRFEVMKMPDVSGLGSYTECGQAIVVRHGEERGEYLHAMYVDSHPAIASGREVSAYPKKLGAPKLLVDSDTLVGTLDYGSLRVAVATMGYKHQPLDAEAARQEIGVPTFTGAWRGPARLQLFEHVLAPLADLPVREIVSASHIVADLSLAPARLVHDYLAGPR